MIALTALLGGVAAVAIAAGVLHVLDVRARESRLATALVVGEHL